jgi:hypothetical protein
MLSDAGGPGRMLREVLRGRACHLGAHDVVLTAAGGAMPWRRALESPIDAGGRTSKRTDDAAPLLRTFVGSLAGCHRIRPCQSQKLPRASGLSSSVSGVTAASVTQTPAARSPSRCSRSGRPRHVPPEDEWPPARTGSAAWRSQSQEGAARETTSSWKKGAGRQAPRHGALRRPAPIRMGHQDVRTYRTTAPHSPISWRSSYRRNPSCPPQGATLRFLIAAKETRPRITVVMNLV